MGISEISDIPLLAINARLVIELGSVPHGTKSLGILNNFYNEE